ILKVGLLLIVFRLAGLAERYLLQPHGPLAARAALFAPAAAAHAGVLLIITAAFLAIAAIAPRFDRAVTIGACVVCAVLMIAGQADFTVSAITGAPLTPTVFRTYRGLHVVKSKEFLEPLRANLGVTLGGVGAFLVVVVWMSRLVRTRVVRPGDTRVWPVLGVGALLVLVAAAVPWPVPPPPIEVAFAREYLHLDEVHVRGGEAEASVRLRGRVGLPSGAHWADDQYPLVYDPAQTSKGASRRESRPDVVVVMVESLRAEELSFVTGSHETVTPNLDALAAQSVVFPTYISNAFPSAPSVFSFHCSAWPHRRKEIITDFATRTFDCLPSRLASFGYETVYVGADPHFDNQDVWLGQWYARVVDLVAQGIDGTDRNIVSRSIDEIRRHDATEGDRPLFPFVSTYSMHYPFTLPTDAGEALVGRDGGLRPQYRQTLHYTDRELGRLFEVLESRHRRTVTIVVGDHGFYVDLARISGVPENDNEWTAAIVNGPDDLIGAPRRVIEAASHVDMMPTVLAMVGDERPTASLGSDLFGHRRTAAAEALAVRAGGIRLDRDGYSAIVDARVPNVVTPRVAFPQFPPAAASPSVPSADELIDWVNDWSYLIEKNRVWNARFIH